MSLNLLTTTKVNTEKLSKVLSTNLSSKVISIDLSWYASRAVHSGKVIYNPNALPRNRFIAPPKQFYILDADGPIVTMTTDGFGTIVTKPSELLDGRYDFLRFHASMHYDACALMDIEDVRKNLNLTYQFSVGDLNNDIVIIGDNKKVRTSFTALDKDDPKFAECVEKYAVLGKLVLINRQSKNAAPSTTQIGLLTATGILYRLDEQFNSATAIGCLSV